MKFAQFLFLCFGMALCLLSSIKSAGQENKPVRFRSSIQQLTITGDGASIITSKVGEVAISTGKGQLFEMRPPIVENNNIGVTIDQSNFFNRDTGIISGYIKGAGKDYDILYRTTNAGKTWTPVEFGQSGWVDDAVHLSNGEAWLSVAGSGFAYTNDYGVNWQKIIKPANKERYTKIFFNGKREGLIGSLWNSIAYTPDNGSTWQMLPTPLDQKAYHKTDREHRPEFNAVAIFGNYFLAQQEGLVFYTERAKIQWQPLAALKSFYTDAGNSAFFGITQNNNCVRFNHLLQQQQSMAFGNPVESARCADSSLYLYANDSIYCWKSTADWEVFPVACNDTVFLIPEYISGTGFSAYGRDGTKIYQQGAGLGWNYWGSVPPEELNALVSMESDSAILCTHRDGSLNYYTRTGVLIKQSSIRNLLQDFIRPGLFQLSFSKGSRGCFHYKEDRLDYTLFNGQFQGAVSYSNGEGNEHDFADNPPEIGIAAILEFLQTIPFSKENPPLPAIADLDFTESEYRQCKNDIRQFIAVKEGKKKQKDYSFYFNQNNLDNAKLMAQVDSVRSLSPNLINAFLSTGNEFWSTSSQWDALYLTNTNKEVLVLQNMYYKNSGWEHPWQIMIGGFRTVLPNWPVNRFIDQLYPGFINYGNKTILLHQLVRGLYNYQ